MKPPAPSSDAFWILSWGYRDAGDATFSMIEVLKKDQPKAAAMLDAPREKAKNLRNAFLYAQGARYVKALKERGGWEAVNNAYRFPPETTADVLHTIEQGIPGTAMLSFAFLPEEERKQIARIWLSSMPNGEMGFRLNLQKDRTNSCGGFRKRASTCRATDGIDADNFTSHSCKTAGRSIEIDAL